MIKKRKLSCKKLTIESDYSIWGSAVESVNFNDYFKDTFTSYAEVEKTKENPKTEASRKLKAVEEPKR
jgi:hypothetical protein